MKGRPIIYSAEERAWVKAHAHDDRHEAHAAFVARFNRPDVTFANYDALRKRNGWHTGRSGRFVKGGPSLWKGRKRKPHPNSDQHQFKKGQSPHNTKWLGHERINLDGYIEISVAETNPHTGYHRRYVLKHRWLWEKLNGKVPRDHCLKSIDGNKTNTDPANWVLVPRALLPRLNGRFGRNYDTAPAELKPVILAIAKLEHKARQKRKPEKEVTA